MISRQEARFLRQRAERLREIAGTHPTPLSSQLRRMADELDKRADELEKTDRSPIDPPAAFAQPVLLPCLSAALT